MAQERGIKSISICTTFSWSGKTATEAALTMGDILLDSTDLGTPQEFSTERVDNLTLLDGVKLGGVIRYAKGAANIPADNTAFVLVVTPFSGAAKVYGGSKGFVGRNLPTGLKALSSGRSYNDLVFEAVDVNIAALEEAASGWTLS